MATYQNVGSVIEFSKDLRYLCYSDSNANLKIWDVFKGTLKQEYAHSSHLSVQCTCLSWGCAATQTNKNPKKKRKKSALEAVENELELIALGGSDGSILLYDVQEAVIHSSLIDGHDCRVMALSWKPDGSRLYSCSDDGHIIEWDVDKTSVIHKWKSDQGQLTSLTLCHSQRHLLTAGRNIQLWDLKSRKVLQTFLGHTSEVTRLLEIPSVNPLNNSRNCDDAMECDDGGVDGSYIFSMARDEKKISVRQISKAESRTTDLVASFSVPEEPVQMSVHASVSDKQMVQMVVLTKQGRIAYYESVLNGRHKKPLKAKQLTTIVTQNGEKERILPIVASSFNPSDGSLCVVYEDFIVPVFETISPVQLKDQLVRIDPKSYKIPSSVDGSGKVETKDVVSNVLGKRVKIEEVTFGERLAAEEKMLEGKSNASTVRTEGAAILLAQGLRSNDKKILNAVLQKTNPDYIRVTVSDLPNEYLAPLIKELHRKMSGHAQSGLVADMWMKALLTVRSTSISLLPNKSDLLQPIMTTRLESARNLSKVLELSGRLEVLLSKMVPTMGTYDPVRDEPFALEICEDEIELDGSGYVPTWSDEEESDDD